MKDRFSMIAGSYSTYRPPYPLSLLEFIQSLDVSHRTAWDCGTGNGQLAVELATFFQDVYATDISEAQLAKAPQKKNLHYSVQPAEQTNFETASFDLITVAQAIHWFDFEKFYAECKRVAQPTAIICVIGYARIRIDKAIDELIDNFYWNVIGSYWDKERRYIDEQYQTIPFPFEEIQVPTLTITLHWTLHQLLGYLHTWSAVTKFIQSEEYDPIINLKEKLTTMWGPSECKLVQFPLLLRAGRIHPIKK